MYTDSVKSEKRLRNAIERSIYYSEDPRKQDGQQVSACTCPKCRKGNIITHYKSYGEYGLTFRHICEVCGEEYDLRSIQHDIWEHSPCREHEKAEAVWTPFGKIHVRRNGTVIPFTYWREKFRSYSAKRYEKAILVHKIRIDLKNLKIGDVVNCGFDKDTLEFYDSDERSVCYNCENDRYLLAYAALDIEPDEAGDYCFEVAYDGRDGMSYRIVRDPAEYRLREYNGADSIWIDVAWVEKKDHKDMECLDFLY